MNNAKQSIAGIIIGLPNSSNKGFDIKAGVIDNLSYQESTKERIA